MGCGVSADLRAADLALLRGELDVAEGVPALVRAAAAAVTATLDAERSSLYLFDWSTMALKATVTEGLEGREISLPLRMGIVGTAILRRELTNVKQAHAHPYFNDEIDSALGYHTETLLAMPVLASTGKALGGLQLLNKAGEACFGEDDEAAIRLTAARLGRWMENGDAYPAGIEAEMIALRNETRADRGTLFSLEARSGRLMSMYADGDGRPLSLNLNLGIAGVTAVTGQSLLIDDAWQDERFDRSVDMRTGFRTRTVLCAPLRCPGGEVVGVVQAINHRGGHFSTDHLAVLEQLADVIGAGLDRLVPAGERRVTA